MGQVSSQPENLSPRIGNNDPYSSTWQDVRELYERKLERTNNLYLELSAVLLQVEQRENELARLGSIACRLSLQPLLTVTSVNL
jgi:hypothetical protein